MNQHCKKIYFEILLLFIVFPLCSIITVEAQYLYESDDANILLIQEKGNWNSSFSFFRNLKFEKRNTSFQTGFSPIDHLVLPANLFYG